MDERIKAVIDADFFRKLTEYERGIGLFLRVMDDLGMEPIMHEFVADIELKGNVYLQELLDAKRISIVRYEDYLKKEDYEEYEEYFRTAYERIIVLIFRMKIYTSMRNVVKALEMCREKYET